MKTMASMVVLAGMALGTTGCYATWDVGPRELGKLQGYRAPQTVEMEDPRGARFAFSEGTELVFHEKDRAFAERLDAIDLSGSTLRGIKHEGREQVAVDLRRVDRVEAKRLSVGGTTGLVVGVTLGAATVATVVGGLIAVSNMKFNLGFR